MNTPVQATAPGKLLLAGEYAVLEGAPAWVLAIDRQAAVRAMPSEDGDWHVAAPDIGIDHAIGRQQRGSWYWQVDHHDVTGRLKLVTTVLEASGIDSPRRLELDTSAFITADGTAKLGLGSSAALTVALAGAAARLASAAMPTMDQLLTMHRRLQDGRGSGADVACSLLGGGIAYRLDAGQPSAQSLPWPDGLKRCVVWTGHAASTGDALAHLASWRNAHRRDFDHHMRVLTDVSAAIVGAVGRSNINALLDGCVVYRDRLAAFGTACGIDIISRQHRLLAKLGNDCGVIYKSCGAGGGDVGVALSADQSKLDHFAQAIAGHGFRVLDMATSATGLVVTA